MTGSSEIDIIRLRVFYILEVKPVAVKELPIVERI
jgi:hypothetical protein